MANLPFGQIGKVTRTGRLVIKNKAQSAVVDCDIATLKNAWQKPLAWQ